MPRIALTPRLRGMAIAVDNDAVFRQHLAHGYNLFAGAGFSVGATGSHGKLPIGDRFADDLRSRFQLDSNRRLSLPQVYAIAERSDPEALRRLVEETFTVVSFDERYKTLNKIAPKCILTTNVDDLFHLIFQSEKAYFLNDVYRTGAPRSRRSAIDLVQVHGSVRDPDREMVFGPFDLAASAAIDPDRCTTFATRSPPSRPSTGGMDLATRVLSKRCEAARRRGRS